MYFFSGAVLQKLFQKLEAIQANQPTMMKDIAKLKAVLIRQVPDQDDRIDMLSRRQKYQNAEEFQDFCEKLEDRNYREMFVCIG